MKSWLCFFFLTILVPFLDLALQSVDKVVEAFRVHFHFDDEAEVFGASFPVIGGDDVFLYEREELAGRVVLVLLIVERFEVAPRGVEHVVVPRLFVVEVEQILLHLVVEQIVRFVGDGGVRVGRFGAFFLRFRLFLPGVIGELFLFVGRGMPRGSYAMRMD